MFGGRPGPWDESWRGWWGEDPPYHHPVFVLTSHPREPLELQGGTMFRFVTDGIESALERARAAAGDKDVSLGGGASVAQQYLAAGLLGELVVSVVPILLGGGARLFENVGDARLEQVESVEAPGVTHIRYRRAELDVAERETRARIREDAASGSPTEHHGRTGERPQPQ